MAMAASAATTPAFIAFAPIVLAPILLSISVLAFFQVDLSLLMAGNISSMKDVCFSGSFFWFPAASSPMVFFLPEPDPADFSMPLLMAFLASLTAFCICSAFFWTSSICFSASFIALTNSETSATIEMLSWSGIGEQPPQLLDLLEPCRSLLCFLFVPSGLLTLLVCEKETSNVHERRTFPMRRFEVV